MQVIRDLLRRPAVQQFIKYVIVGCIVTAIDMAALHLFYRILHVHIKISVVIGFMFGNVSSFIFNKYYTFRNFSPEIFRQYAKYIITSITGLLWTLFLMTLFFEKWNLFAVYTQNNYLLCKALVAVLVMFWNFTIIRHWTLASYDLSPLLPLSYFNKTNTCYLSVVIPAYNEEKRLPNTLRAVHEWLSQQSYSWEIFIVDDGSKDGTLRMLETEFKGLSNLRVHALGQNQGKGAAVRAGMLMAGGEYRLFMDADHQIRISELDVFLAAANPDTVIIGSKYLHTAESPKGAKISFARMLVSRFGNLIIRLLLNLNIKDTQCGFKLFPAAVAESVFRLQKLHGFAFDVEILTLASLFQKRILELPIVLHETEDTRVRALKDSISVFADLIGIKLNIWRKKYKHIPNVATVSKPANQG